MSLDDALSMINKLLPEPQGSLLAGMLFGARRTIPPDLYQALIATGTVHTVALSGMNITILVRVLFDGLGWLLGKTAGVVVTFFGIGLFVWFVGPSPTVIRASLMGGIAVSAAYFGRKDIPLLSLALTAVAMLLYDHTLFTNVSFQLSLAATSGILLFGPEASPFARPTTAYKKPFASILVLSGLPGELRHFFELAAVWFLAEFRVTVAAQLFTMPIIFYHFRQISVIAPLANVLTGWLIPWIMYLGFLALFAGAVYFPLGHVFAVLTWVPLTVFLRVVEFFSKIPGASIRL